MELWKELTPPDQAGVVWIDPLITPEGRGNAYVCHRLLNDLYFLDARGEKLLPGRGRSSNA